MAQAANPFFGTYKTPHQTVPFDKIKLSHYEPAFKKAIEENQKEIDAIVNQRSMPTFENTIEALDRSGQMLNRVASAFFALLSAESNDEMMEISQRVQPMLSEHSNNISLNEKLFDRIKFVYDRRDQLDLLLLVVLVTVRLLLLGGDHAQSAQSVGHFAAQIFQIVVRDAHALHQIVHGLDAKLPRTFEAEALVDGISVFNFCNENDRKIFLAS